MADKIDLDEVRSLLDYAVTQNQRDMLEAILEHKGVRATSRALGTTQSNVSDFLRRLRVRAARRGHSPAHDVDSPTPPGYMLRGTSTLYDGKGGRLLQWVKTKEDWAAQYAAMEEALQDLFADVPPRAPVPVDVESRSDDVLVLYPEGDPHWGMRVWGQETDGTNYDLQIAVDEYRAAVEWLVERAPPSETAIALNVGDNFHADNPDAVTPRAGNRLHVDSRLGKVFQTVLEARVFKIEQILRKHNRVVVREVYGNHDPVLCLGFTKALVAYYRNEPRVEVVDSPNTWWHYQHGHVMLGTTHGDRCKIKDMPLLMATDAPTMWGATKFRHCYTGHQHHLERWEEPGCVVEMLRTLAARNEYEYMAGYRSGRDMMVRVFHRRYGEVLTHRLGIELVRTLLRKEEDGAKA